MTTLFLDLETYSEVPLKHGTHRYAEAAEIMVAAWAVDDGPVQVDDLTNTRRDSLKEMFDFRWQIKRASTIVIHNSYFDRTVLRYNGIDLLAHKIHDTMVQALAHSLPGGLAALCDILKVPFDKAKDKDGKRLINLFCKERPKRQKVRRYTRETHPEEWQKFLDYAALDIEAMREVYRRLPKWNNIETERRLWLLDQKINDHGVSIDLEFVQAALRHIGSSKEELASDVQELTGDQVQAATQRDALISFIAKEYEVPLDDLRADTVERMLENDNYPPELLELLRIRLLASSTSVGKYQKLIDATSADGYLRGVLQFCGANRTGRWAGRLFQPQNLPRPFLGAEVIDDGIQSMKDECFEELVSGPVIELASNALRGVIVASPGKKLRVADLSNIEGRVITWLAGEQWKLDAFAAYDRGDGPDLYKLTAGRILGKKPDAVTKKERQEVGKVAELALGFEGGVGAFITFATAYNIDLEELAAIARTTINKADVIEAGLMWGWMKEKKRNTYGLSESTWIGIESIKRSWRGAHPAIASMWKELKEAATAAIFNPGKRFTVGRVTFVRSGAWLRCILPSGRSLCYPAPQVDDSGQISYMGVNQYTRQWSRIKTYGGKLAENITQAVARDVLAHGMLLADQHGFEVLLSVHDELITETPEGWMQDHAVLESLMATNPPWADGLPLSAGGFDAYRYRKD